MNPGALAKQPCSRIKRNHVVADAWTLPIRCARIDNRVVGTWRYSFPVIISRMFETSSRVNWLGMDLGHDGMSVNPHSDFLTHA